MKKKKILFLCPYPFDIAAGQRFKFENCYYHLRNNGFSVTINSFYSINDFKEIHKKKNYFNKIKILLFAYIKRLIFISKSNEYDLVYIFLWIFPLGGYFLENFFLKKNKIKSIYDMEDDLLIIQKSQVNKISYFFKKTSKFQFLIQNTDLTITSTLELENKYKKIYPKKKFKYIQPTIDHLKYFKKNQDSNDKYLTIGWTGTFSSKKYLDLLIKPLHEVVKKFKFKLLIIGNFEFEIDQIDYEVIFWDKVREVEQLHKIDIGLYPVFDEPWSYGKSGLKALQYMSNGIPLIASKTIVNQRIIENHIDGILVENDEKSWTNAIIKLINDKELRQKLSENARKKIIQNYSSYTTSKIYLNLFNDLIN